jgi:hypothetical protein
MSQRRHLRAGDDLLEPAVSRSIEAMLLRPEDGAVAALALMIACSLDEMDEGTRGRMLGQTSGALLRCLAELRERSTAPAAHSRLQALREARVRQRRIGGSRISPRRPGAGGVHSSLCIP